MFKKLFAAPLFIIKKVNSKFPRKPDFIKLGIMKNRLVSSGVIILVILGAILLADNGRNYLPVKPGAQAANNDARIRVTPDTELVQKITYAQCGDQEEYRVKTPENLIGLNLLQFQKVYAGWTIDQFDIKQVEMSLQVDSLCREHANNMYIGIKDGYVSVFYGSPGNKPIVKEVTAIPAGKLMPQDIEELQRGMVVHSKEDLLRTLEGMQAR